MLSRRQAIRGLGAAAVVGLPGCGTGDRNGGSIDPPAPPIATVIGGYTDQQSYRPGDRVVAYLNGPSSVGSTIFYGDFPGQPSSLVLTDVAGRTVFAFSGVVIPQNAVGPNPWESGFGYQASARFTLPNLPSGVYLINGVVPVIVKAAPTESADIVILAPTNTVAAYNFAGGKSLYPTGSLETAIAPSPMVSFLRPVIPPAGSDAQTYYYYPFLEWLANQPLPYSVRFIADIDMDDAGELYGAKLLMVIGHSEYWTRLARENFDAFVSRGGSALLLSGNNMWWQVRYSEDRTQMICYKSVSDPIADPLLKTINWPNPSLQYPVVPSIGADFDHGGYGIKYPDKGWKGYRILTPSAAIFRGVDIASGDVLALPSGEYDGAPIVNDPVTAGAPRLDYAALGAYKAEIIGYDYCVSGPNGSDRVATWIALQRAPTSGVILNGASTDWCSPHGVAGTDGERIKQIIRNMIDALVNQQSVFAE